MTAMRLWKAAFAGSMLLSGLAGAAEVTPRTPPTVAVVDSPAAERWLERAGISFARRTGAGLGAGPVRDAKILVLPLQSVARLDAARTVQAYIDGGGKVLAVYWGTLAPRGADAYPVYDLVGALGVRPVGWQGRSPQPLVLDSGGAGALPYTGSRVLLPGCPAVLAEAAPGTKILARWSGGGAPARSGAVFLRGGVAYVAVNVLQPEEDATNCRELFFWTLQRLSPALGSTLQAKDRIATAAGACAAVTSLLSEDAPPEIRPEVDTALAALSQARTLLESGRAASAVAAADRARAIAEQVLARLAGSRVRGPGSRAPSLGSGVQGPRSKVQGPRSKVQSPKSRVAGREFRVSGPGPGAVGLYP
jgi:hypothetical protein